jgi:hypothetical protein
MTDETKPAAPGAAATAEALKPKWDPSIGKLSGCPVCGIIPELSVTVTIQTQQGKVLRVWRHDPARPAAYQALVVHMHGLPAIKPSADYPKGMPAIPGMHPDVKLPPEPAADIKARDEAW